MAEKPLSENDVEILEKTEAFRGYFRVDRYRLRHRLFRGGWSPEMTREVFERGHAAAVLPYDPVRDEVILIEQFRIGALAAGKPPWLLEIVAGIIEEGENAEEVVIREAVEEANCKISNLIPVAEYMVSPGGTSESVSVFCGKVDSSGAGGIFGEQAEHEDIRVVVLSFADAAKLLDARRIDNAITLVSLQWLALNRDKIRRKWGAT